ncbi:MAG: DUF4430 domain-containing protein [Clostridia bacterium]|nr:DUF4430 domain-containing protein [Clostridia bacterium]
MKTSALGYEEAEEIAADIIQSAAARSEADSAETWLDGELTQLAGQGAEWFVFALAGLDEDLDFEDYYSALVNYIDTSEGLGAVESQRIALAMVSVGAYGHSFVAETVENKTGAEGIMSLVFGLNILNNGVTATTVTPDSVVAELLELQCADGGWALSGDRGDVDVTAMTLAALAPHREDETVAAAVEKAIGFLSEAQLPSGDFMSYGVANAESAAQVIIALAALKIDPLTDPRFAGEKGNLLDVLMGYQTENGGFSHAMDGPASRIATAQSLCAIVALQRYQKGETPLYALCRPAVEYEITPAGMSGPGYKFWVCIGVGICAAGAVIFVLAKRASGKNILFILLGAAVICGAVIFTDIKSEDEYFAGERKKGAEIGSVTLEVRADSVKDLWEECPEGGIIVPEGEFTLFEGDSVYDILSDGLKAEGLLFETEGGTYVSGIAGLYERQYGDLSGWIYFVNGESVSVGSTEYLLSDGDSILWIYSLEMGRDINIPGK